MKIYRTVLDKFLRIYLVFAVSNRSQPQLTFVRRRTFISSFNPYGPLHTFFIRHHARYILEIKFSESSRQQVAKSIHVHDVHPLRAAAATLISASADRMKKKKKELDAVYILNSRSTDFVFISTTASEAKKNFCPP